MSSYQTRPGTEPNQRSTDLVDRLESAIELNPTLDQVRPLLLEAKYEADKQYNSSQVIQDAIRRLTDNLLFGFGSPSH